MNLPRLLLALAAAGILTGPAQAVIPIPSDGSDGNFNPASNVEIDLAQAVTGAWDASNSANAGKGRYDPTKWAVVFKYASVNIPAGVTVTFKNHPTHAPVMWLVAGNVTINGTVSVAGKDGTRDTILGLTPAEPGPGGFRGGPFNPSATGAGLGPGGGGTGIFGIGRFGDSYGNPQLVPLIGGSGGGGNGNFLSGAGGGGAILIASVSVVSINGSINANGGASDSNGNPNWGSGGAIKIIAEQIAGTGLLSAIAPQFSGSLGRIRLETYSLASTIQRFPDTIAVPPASTPIIFPGSNAPTVRVVSVAVANAPTDPTAPLGSSADIGIQANTAVTVVIETKNFPISGTVQLRGSGKFGGFALQPATYASGDFTTATWTVSSVFTPGFSTLQAIATAP